MELVVTHRTLGSEAYLLLRAGDGAVLLYDRRAREVDRIAEPGRLARRGTWVEFDGDGEAILDEVRVLLGASGRDS
jgi:hypothetical protein